MSLAKVQRSLNHRSHTELYRIGQKQSMERGKFSDQWRVKTGEKTMNIKFEFILLCALGALPAIAQAQVPAGRWEIVHTSGDSSAQTSLYPGGFSTYPYSDGTGNSTATAANSICVIDETSSNVVPSWTSLGGNDYQITIAVNNIGLGPNVSFIYTGRYSATTAVPGDASLQIPAITGTYYVNGNGSACSTTTATSPGNFVATFLPDLTSGSSTGSLDSSDTDDGTPFDQGVSTTINFSAPPSAGQIAGTVSLGTNATFNGNAYFASTGGVPNPLTISSSSSNEAGILNGIYAQGFDPSGNTTTLVLQGYSANLYTTTNNTDATAYQLTTDEWASAAAIGEDDPDAEGTQGIGATGVEDDGTNNVLLEFYNVVGGICDGAGGSDAPFHFLSGSPLPKHHSKHHHRRHHHIRFSPADWGVAREVR
jgi:hypothetical protein